MEYLAALNAFCLQLNEFCQLFQSEVLRQLNLPLKSPSDAFAERFAETIMLCPTSEAARNAVRRDLAGARSFLIAADSVLRKLRSQRFQFAAECPAYQTRFYLLACAVKEMLELHRQQQMAQTKSFHAGKVPVLPA